MFLTVATAHLVLQPPLYKPEYDPLLALLRFMDHFGAYIDTRLASLTVWDKDWPQATQNKPIFVVPHWQRFISGHHLKHHLFTAACALS